MDRRSFLGGAGSMDLALTLPAVRAESAMANKRPSDLTGLGATQFSDAIRARRRNRKICRLARKVSELAWPSPQTYSGNRA